MELAFAAPLWAWAFAGLVVPILIHFFANRWQQPRRFAALRFLQPAAEQGRAKRISDWLLLLLRLLLLVLVIMALMTPTLSYPVARSKSLTLIHPVLTAADAELTGTGAVWLCRDARLANARCPDDDGYFVDSLQQLAAQQPDLASVTAWVPATLAVPALTLPPLPITVHWQSRDVADLAGGKTRTVAAAAEYAPLFTAVNAVETWPRWQLTTDHQNADLVIDDPDASARVLWHQDALPWQQTQPATTSVEPMQTGAHAFYIVGSQLHLQSESAAALRANPARLAALLNRTEDWLARGEMPWRQPLAALQSWSQPSTIGVKEISLQLALFVAALLVLGLERGLVHGRR